MRGAKILGIRARIVMSLPGSSSKRQTLWAEQNGMCLYCGKDLGTWLSENCCFDHIFPKSLGGTDANTNLALVCYPCNALKSDFTSLGQVIAHFSKMIKLFWRLSEVSKVKKAMEDGRIKASAECTCKIHARKKLPNVISKMGQAPKHPGNGSVRVKNYERRLAAFHRITGTPVDSSNSS